MYGLIPKRVPPLRGQVIHVTSEVREALAPEEALVFDWHRVAICCAVARSGADSATATARIKQGSGIRRIMRGRAFVKSVSNELAEDSSRD